jgi:predicted nucleic acid-binding protein
MPVLDSSFLIDAQNGLAAAKKALETIQDERLLVPYQAALEFVSGFQDQVAGLRVIRENFELLLPDEDQLLEAATMFRRAATNGKRMSWADLHIAAVAKLEDDVLLTADARAMRSTGVRVWDYRNAPRPQV